MTKKGNYKEKPTPAEMRDIFFNFKSSKTINIFLIYFHLLGMAFTIYLLVLLSLYSSQFKIFILILLKIISFGIFVCLVIYIKFWIKFYNFRKKINMKKVFRNLGERKEEKNTKKFNKVFEKFELSRFQVRLTYFFYFTIFYHLSLWNF